MDPTRGLRSLRRRAAGLSVTLTLALALAACGGSGGPVGSPSSAEPAVVQVELTDFAIAMPASIAGGSVTFEVLNSGVAPHNLVIEGNGVEATLDPDLLAGESGELSVTLPPGSYEVYCSVIGHRDLGMVAELEVTAE